MLLLGHHGTERKNTVAFISFIASCRGGVFNVGHGVCGPSGTWTTGRVDSSWSVDFLSVSRSLGDCERKWGDVRTCSSTVFHSHPGVYGVGHVPCVGATSAETLFVERCGLGSDISGYGTALRVG